MTKQSRPAEAGPKCVTKAPAPLYLLRRKRNALRGAFPNINLFPPGGTTTLLLGFFRGWEP